MNIFHVFHVFSDCTADTLIGCLTFNVGGASDDACGSNFLQQRFHTMVGSWILSLIWFQIFIIQSYNYYPVLCLFVMWNVYILLNCIFSIFIWFWALNIFWHLFLELLNSRHTHVVIWFNAIASFLVKNAKNNEISLQYANSNGFHQIKNPHQFASLHWHKPYNISSLVAYIRL